MRSGAEGSEIASNGFGRFTASRKATRAIRDDGDVRLADFKNGRSILALDPARFDADVPLDQGDVFRCAARQLDRRRNLLRALNDSDHAFDGDDYHPTSR